MKQKEKKNGSESFPPSGHAELGDDSYFSDRKSCTTIAGYPRPLITVHYGTPFGSSQIAVHLYFNLKYRCTTS